MKSSGQPTKVAAFQPIINSIFQLPRVAFHEIMQDTEIAKERLHDKNLTRAIAKNGIIFFQTDSHRISGFIGAIEKFGIQINSTSVADRAAGKALALLCVYAE